MAPLPVINRGFGGSRIHQVVHYVDRIVVPITLGRWCCLPAQ